MIPALGNICPIMTKHLHMSICCRNAWDENIIMNEDIFRELQFWCFHCNVLSFKSIVPMNRQPQRVIFTDASQFAGVGFTVRDNTIVHFMWGKTGERQKFHMERIENCCK